MGLCVGFSSGCRTVDLWIDAVARPQGNHPNHPHISSPAGRCALRAATLNRGVFLASLCLTLLFGLAGCASAPQAATEASIEPQGTLQPYQPEAEAPAATEAPPVSEAPAAATEAPVEEPTSSTNVLPLVTQAIPTALASLMPEPTAVSPGLQPLTELKVIELEWPSTIRLGDSDVIRLALIPSEDGYTAQADYNEHNLASQNVEITRPTGYTLSAIARLDGAGFTISPTGNQTIQVQPGEKVTWRWSLSPLSTGRQRISIIMILHWQPDSPAFGQPRDSMVFDRNLEIKVISFMGMRRSDAVTLGFSGLLVGGVLGVWVIGGSRRKTGKDLLAVKPAGGLSIEAPTELSLDVVERTLLQTLFKKYQRLILRSEFLSGYSGARTFLVQPLHPNGQSDAETIVKIGPNRDIEAEFGHYKSYVKDRLPPVTARIQSVPITVAGSHKAAMQYTCISEPGKSPTSLRQALLANPDPEYLQKLFVIFGPYWWMQRQPYSFCMAQEYDRLLPPHFVLQPDASHPKKIVSPALDPARNNLTVGDEVLVSAFNQYENRADGKSLTLLSSTPAGKTTFRYRWLKPVPPNGTAATIIEDRTGLLKQLTDGCVLCGLPDPLDRYQFWLSENVKGTRSIIHGDLNLENILVGPGNLVWLIDFAQTREGPPLYDFSHLYAEIIAHIISRRNPTPELFLATLSEGSDSLLSKLTSMSWHCLFNPIDQREFLLAVTLSCLGALKYQNLPENARQLLYLAAAFHGSRLK